MPYKNQKEYTKIDFPKTLLKRLDKYRIEDNEAYWKIIKRIIEYQ